MRYRNRQLIPTRRCIIFLTATPHQGRDDQLRARSSSSSAPSSQTSGASSIDPALLASCVFRNRKVDVTDESGEFIFHGQETFAVQVPMRDAERAFDQALRAYLREGYRVSAQGNDLRSRAIGFVMTTFRKLAASSPAAIVRSLKARRQRVQDAIDLAALVEVDTESIDRRFEGEWAEQQIEAHHGAFFAGEAEQLDALIPHGERLLEDDIKLRCFLREVVEPLSREGRREQLLILRGLKLVRRSAS